MDDQEREGPTPESAPASQAPGRPPLKQAQEEKVGTLTRLSDGREYILGFGTHRVGRERKADLVLREKTVSRHHADISYESGRYVLYDQSTNGTWVNGNLVAVAQPLRTNDTVRFGEVEFRFGMKRSDATGAAYTAPSRVPGSSTLIMRSGKRKGGRIAQQIVRSLPWIALLLVLLVGAAIVIYFLFPDLAARIITRLPTALQERIPPP